MSVGTFSPPGLLHLAVSGVCLGAELEQWLWSRVSPWNCCSGCLLWAGEILPFLDGEGTACVGSEGSVQQTNVVPYGVDVSLFCSFPSLEVMN